MMFGRKDRGKGWATLGVEQLLFDLDKGPVYSIECQFITCEVAHGRSIF